MRSRRKLNAILAIVLLCVWGVVGFNVLTALNPREEETTEAQFFPGSKTAFEPAYRYDENVRDPFKYSVHQIPLKGTAAPSRDTVIWIPPPLKLCAIVGAGRDRSAVVEDHTGQIFVLGLHDSLGHLRITKITGNEVRCTFGGREVRWNLE